MTPTTSDPALVARARADWRAADLAALEAECAVKVAHRRLKHATDYLAEVGGLAMGVPTAGKPEPGRPTMTAERVADTWTLTADTKLAPAPPAPPAPPGPPAAEVEKVESAPEMVWQPGASSHSILNRDPNQCTRCESAGRLTLKFRAHPHGATSEEFVCEECAAALRTCKEYAGESECVKECVAEPPVELPPEIERQKQEALAVARKNHKEVWLGPGGGRTLDDALPMPAAPSWRTLTLEEAGFVQVPGTEEIPEAWPEEVGTAILEAGVKTCGELADRLLAGDLFDLEDPRDLDDVYASIEMLSEDDPEPIDFDKLFGPNREPLKSLEENLRRALHRVQGCTERWTERIATGLTDAGLKLAIGEEWEGSGGQLGGGYDYRVKGGTAPAFWFPDVHRTTEDRKPTLVGAALIHKVRELLGIPLASHTGDKITPAAGSKAAMPAAVPAGTSATDPLLIACPKCHAAIGMKCKDYRGKGKATCKERTAPPVAVAPEPAPAPHPSLPFDEPAAFEVGAKPLPAKPLPEFVVDVTRLTDLDGFPDAVADALAPAVTTVATLLERTAEGTAPLGDLPLRNKLVAYLVNRNVKMGPAAKAADAVAARVSKDHLFFGDVPGFPAAAAVHLLREHKLRTVADLVEYFELAATRPDVHPVYEALRVLGLPPGLITEAGANLVAFFGDRFTQPVPDQPSLPFEEPTKADPRDKTAEWEALLDTPAVGGSGQDPKRMRAAIDEFREDQKAGNASPMWATWSEFDVTLPGGAVARVLSKPFWDRESGRHHIEFWSPLLGPTGYWSVTIDRVSGKGGPLIQWAEAEAERRADEYAAEITARILPGVRAKPEPKPAAVTPAEQQLEDLGLLSKTDGPVIVIPAGPEPELPLGPTANERGEPFYGWEITYRDIHGKEQRCHYVGTEKKARGKARDRRGFEKLLGCVGVTKEGYIRAFGKGGM